MSEKIKILIVDDSLLVRASLRNIFSGDEEFEILAEAGDPYVAVQELKKKAPDVITLDVEMPRMDGITFLRKIMSQHPIPVVVISTLTQKGTDTAIKALEYGAVEVYAKPKVNTERELLSRADELRMIVKSAARANLKNLKAQIGTGGKSGIQPLSGKSLLKEKRPVEKVIAIGASTGGTTAIKAVLKSVDATESAILIVQHMPPVFTKQFADRLNGECDMEVREAKDGDKLWKGLVLVAPGDKHMVVKGRHPNLFVSIMDGPKKNHHRPSIDVLFKSVARYIKDEAIGVLMTGMGRDGALGLGEIKDAGAHTIAQNEATSVVFGMPKEAIKLGAATEVLPLGQIGKVCNKTQENTKK